MANRIKKGDLVKIIAGGNKGKSGKVLRVDGNRVFVEKINVKTRHIRPSQLNPQGGKKDVHVSIDISNVALLVDEKITKVGFKIDKDGKKVRVAKATGKEIK